MDGRISMYVLLVCVWCSLDAGGFLMVVTAQPAVSAVILTPEADRKEGGQVDMRCTATNLESNHTVEWRTEDPVQTLRWGETTVDTNGRFIFDTLVDMATQTVVQDFTITKVQRTDTDEYVCIINDPIPTGGSDIVATSNVTLSVLYFPSESFPMCSLSGPITVDAGTELRMRCSSESSHGTVTMAINPTIQTTRYATWTSVINDDNDTVVRRLDLTVDDADNGVAFKCFISSMYFAGMQRTCHIGPITVRNTVTIPMTETTAYSTQTTNSLHVVPKTDPMAQLTTGPQTLTSRNYDLTSTMTIQGSSDQPPSSTPFLENEVTSTSSSASTQSTAPASFSPAVIVGAVAGGLIAFLLIVILIFIYCKRRSGNSDPKSGQSNADINQTNTELTLDRLEHSQISFNEYGELDSTQHGLQDNIIYVPSQSPISGPGTSYDDTAPVRSAQATDPSLIYAKPFRTRTKRTEHEVKKQQSDLTDDPTTQQSYNNPAFDSSVYDRTTSPSGDDLSTPIKPTALVRPTRPSKPTPYKPKPTERRSNASTRTHDDRMIPSSPPPSSVNDGTPSLENADDASYAQVSVPMRQHSSHGNPGSEDHIVYADLDLPSDEILDDGSNPQPASEAVMYSSVMIK